MSLEAVSSGQARLGQSKGRTAQPLTSGAQVLIGGCIGVVDVSDRSQKAAPQNWQHS